LHPSIEFSKIEFAEAVNFMLGLPTPAACDTARNIGKINDRVVDCFGWGLNNLRGTDAGGLGWHLSVSDKGQRTRLHDTVNSFVSKVAKSVHAQFDTELIDFVISKLPPGEESDSLRAGGGQGSSQRNIIPDAKLTLEEDETVGGIGGGVEVFYDTKTVSATENMYFSPRNLTETCVHRREETVHADYVKHAKIIDEAFYPRIEVAPNAGPVENFLQGLATPVKGLAIGPYGEFSTSMNELLVYVAERHDRQYAEMAGVSHRGKGGQFLLDLKRRLSLTVIRSWARLRVERARALIGRYRAKRLSPDVPEYDPMRDGYYAPFELHDEIAARSASSSASW
jgi:hypothetical protein